MHPKKTKFSSVRKLSFDSNFLLLKKLEFQEFFKKIFQFSVFLDLLDLQLSALFGERSYDNRKIFKYELFLILCYIDIN